MRQVGIWGLRVVDEPWPAWCRDCGKSMVWLGAAWCCLHCEEKKEKEIGS